jgi:hypothetical protein
LARTAWSVPLGSVKVPERIWDPATVGLIVPIRVHVGELALAA